MPVRALILALTCTLLLAVDAPADLPAPPEAGAVWDLADAERIATPTRERVCLNGLWRFIPAAATGEPPADGSGWGWSKVPGVWPAAKGQINWKWAGDAQQPLLPAAQGAALADGLQRAWYRRAVAVPAGWAGRRLRLDCAMVNTLARVRWDGAEAGELRWPGGALDLGSATPGEHRLELLIDAGGARETIDTGLYTGAKTKRAARFRGPTGDVHLEAVPAARVAEVRAEPSVRRNRLALAVRLADAPAGARVAAQVVGPDGAVLLDLPAVAVADGRVRLEGAAERLPRWDLHTPGNRLRAVVRLESADGTLLDQALPLEFGMRELWAEGRDLILNGIPFHGRVLSVINHAMPADRASPEACERTLRMAKAWGYNAVNLTGEYEPGEWTDIEALLAAADRVGILVSMATPPAKLLDWTRRDQALFEWTRSADQLLGRVHRHPCVASYSMSFNYGWYYGHEDPRLMDGRYEPEPTAENVANGHRAVMALTEEALRGLDQTRFIYHHHSGNFGAAHTDCIYLNWAPVQERSEWPWLWSQNGVKPLMYVEYGLPHFASWSNYRGPGHLHAILGTQWLWSAEFNAPFTGQEAYRPLANREQLLRDTAGLITAGKPFHNAALTQSGWGFALATRAPANNGWIYREELPVQARYAAQNWRAHRAFGVSWTLPWDQEGYARPAADTPVDPLPSPRRWQDLKRPGLSPDRFCRSIPTGAEIFNHPEPERWAPTVLGREVLRWNRPLAAWIGGGPSPAEVASQDHIWRAGETAAYQLVVVNDQRSARTVAWNWTLAGTALEGRGSAVVAAGGQLRVPLTLALDAGLAPGAYRLHASFTAADEAAQEDARELQLVAAPAPLAQPATLVALWDPAAASAPALRAAGVPFTAISDPAEPGAARVLVIGRGAIDPAHAVPGLEQVAKGLNLLVLEQGEEALRERFGLRTILRGERQLQLRTPGHPALAGLGEALFADWRGASTLVPPYRVMPPPPAAYSLKEDWNGFANAHVQRCGNRGSVASVLFEKPVRADVLPLLDGAFDLQYTALAELRHGAGRIVFCQLDVSGRDQAEPVAALLLNRLAGWLSTAPPPPPTRRVRAAGAEAEALCAQLGIATVARDAGPLGADDLVVIAPGHAAGPLMPLVEQGARVLAVGCGQGDLAAAFGEALPWAAGPTRARFRENWDEPLLAGCSNADLHLRTFLGGGLVVDGGRDTLRVLRQGRGVVVAAQGAPWLFADPARPDLRTTRRRALALCSRLLANLGAASDGGVVARAGDVRLGRLVLAAGWRARVDPGEAYRGGDWTAPAYDERAWPAIRVGEAYNGQLPGTTDHLGVVWYRLRMTLPAAFAGDLPVVLRLGPVDDECEVWLDGVRLGAVSKASNPKDHWSVVKDWPLPPGLLKPGRELVLAVRVNNTYLTGGIMAAPQLLVRRADPYVQELQAGDDPYRYFNW